MKPNELVSLSAPRSVDIAAGAKSATKLATERNTREYERFGLRVCELLETTRPKAKGRSTFSTSGQTWSMAELGQAAAGVPEIAFLAACYSFAGAQSHFWRLHDALIREALVMRRRMNWPMRISGSDGMAKGYIPELCELVLHEDAKPSVFVAAPRLFADYLGITQELWDGQVEDRYTHVKQTYHLWLSDAYRIMAPRLREDYEVLED